MMEKEKPKLTEVIDSNLFSLHFRPDGVVEVWRVRQREDYKLKNSLVGIIPPECDKKEALSTLLHLLTPLINGEKSNENRS